MGTPHSILTAPQTGPLRAPKPPSKRAHFGTLPHLLIPSAFLVEMVCQCKQIPITRAREGIYRTLRNLRSISRGSGFLCHVRTRARAPQGALWPYMALLMGPERRHIMVISGVPDPQMLCFKLRGPKLSRMGSRCFKISRSRIQDLGIMIPEVTDSESIDRST